MGAFDDLVPRSGNGLAAPDGKPQRTRRESNAGAFDDLIPGADGVWSADAEQRTDFAAGLREANDPQSTMRNSMQPTSGQPAVDEGFVGNAMRYPKEFGKAIVRGAADLAGTALKFGAAVQTVGARDMQRFVRRQLEVQDLIDRGQAVTPGDDHYGYAAMPPAERQATKQRLANRLAEFDLPGGVQDRDFYKAGEFVSNAGQKAAPAAPGWEDSTTANLGQGVGSVVAGLPVAAGGVGAGALVFGAAGGGEALERAIQHKAAPDDQLKAAILGTGPGVTDVAPIELLLRSNRFTAPFSSQLANAVARIGGNAFVEGIQEGGQQFLQNLIARDVYKPDQQLGEDVLPNTAMGAGVGGITATAVELARLFGGRRGAHSQPQPERQEEVGSATGGAAAAPYLPAGGVGRDWVGDTGRNAMAPAGAPAAPRDGLSGEASGAFDDLIPTRQNGQNPTSDNISFRNLEPFDNGLGPEAMPHSWPLPSLPDLGLTAKGERLAFGGSGEALSKRFRHVERTSLQTAAERLTRDVEAYHSELADSGASAADIAKGLAETFGIEATPADIEAGNVWWRVPQRGSIEAPEGFSARRFTDLTEEQRAAIRGLAASGEDTASIARQLGIDATKVGAEVQAAKPRVQRPRSQARALSNIGELYSHHELAGLNAIDAAARLSEVLGRPISPKSIYKARERAAQKGAPLPPMAGRGPGVWSSEALALMERLGAKGVKAPAIAATLNEQFPEFGGRLTANAIRVRRSNLARGLTAGGRSKAPDAKALLDQPAFNESAYREAHAELQMLVGDKSKEVSNERYARLISERFGRNFSPAEVGELRERAREAFRQMTGRQPNFAIGAGEGAFDDLVADAQDIEAAKAAGMWPEGSDQNQQEALNRFRQARVVAEIASEIESRRLPDLAMTGEVGAANRARAGRPAARDAIEIAKRMDARGASRDDIWQQTADYFRQQDPALIGVFKGADGKWRVEVSDLMAAFVGRAAKGGQKLDKVMTDMLRHDELYLTYPDLQRARAGWEIGQKAYARALAKGLPTGMYVSSTRSPDGTEMIAAGAPSTNALLPPIMHETQHGVQQREGFARGSSRGNDVDAYLRQAGEVEARNVEARLAMTDEQRRATPPWDTEDTTASEQIISYFGDRAESYGARRRGGARPINWEAPAVRAEMEGVARRSGGYARTGTIGPMGGARGPDFTWPPAALQMLRENEGKSFSVIARALSDRFGVTITRDMVSGKVRRLRGLSDSDGPLLAASDNPEGWFARFKRGSNAQAGGSSQVRDGLDQTGRKVSGGAPGTSEAPGAGTGRNAAGRASGSVGRFDVGRFAGRVVETPNAHGLRQRRYFLFSPTSEIPGLTHSPGVAVRTLNAMRNWTAKAHVTEVSPGEWRVLKVSVRSNVQRRGVGTALYNAMNRDLGADLGPSPTMSRKLLQFWRKRDAAAVAKYQQIGNVYHSPAMLRSLKRVNDELLRNPPSARDAAYAKRFASVIDDALANAEDLPQWARSDVTARSFVHQAAKRGEPLSIPKPVVDRMLEGVANAQSRLPAGAEAGVLESVEPIKGRAPSYRGADVVARFRMLDGSTFDVDLPLGNLTRMRAFYDNFSGRIGLTRFGLFGGLDQSIAGEIDHEVVHFLRRQGRLSGETWGRLVGHAHNLRLLDGPLATYLKMVGDPAAHKARPDLTLREAYEGLYRNTTDFAERMDQEAVAHMRELYTHGQLLPQEVAPVQDILDALNAHGNVPAVSLDDFIAHADENTDYRDQATGAFDDLIPGRSISKLGYYSKLDEVLLDLRPTDTVTANTLQKRGVKQSEIQARGIADALAWGKAARVSDLKSIAAANPVNVIEVRRGDGEREYRELTAQISALANRERALRRSGRERESSLFGRGATTAQLEEQRLAIEGRISALVDPGVKWAGYSLDPSNPTYRETVLHLPSTNGVDWQALRAKIEDMHQQTPPLGDPRREGHLAEINRLRDEADNLGGSVGQSKDFRSGHWNEPNVIAHARTSLLKNAQGKTVFHVDELQSDWGQKLRDTGGGRDASKIAKLRDELNSARDARDAFLMGEPLAFLRRAVRDYPARTNPGEVERFLSRVARGEFGVTHDDMDEASGFRLDQRLSTSRIERLDAEIRTNEAAAPGHPLVNTTDQWVNTALRRMIRQAIDEGADYIAIPSGQTVLNYGMGGEAEGIRYAYDQMYPKNLRNLLRKIDPRIEGRKASDLRNPESGKVSPQLESATVFPLTDTVKGSVLADGQPMFALSADDPKVTTPGGEMEVTVRPEVVDFADLKEATGALQPRDRSRAESAVGVRDRAVALDPSRLMPERVSDNGAPLVTAGNVVLSGNGRVMSIGEAYRDPVLSDRAALYRAAVIAYAKREGLGNAVESMRYPVLVSRITDKLSQDELARFADLSNRSAIAEMSSPERAMRDARAVGPQILGLYRGGDFTSTDNREFYRAFMDGAVSANERGSVSRDGLLTKEGEDRMSAAVLAGAYGDPAMLSRMLEATDDNIRSVTGAMRDAAGGFVRLKQAIDAGEVDRAFDITPQLAEAARRIADLRSRKVSLQAFLAQQDAFNRLDPIVEDLLRGFHNESLTRARSREKLTELLASYAEEAIKHKQNGLIPDETTPAIIVDYAAKRAAQTVDDIVAGSTSHARGTDDRARPQDRGPQPDGNRAAAGSSARSSPVTPTRPSNAMAGGLTRQATSNAMATMTGMVAASRAPQTNAMVSRAPLFGQAQPPSTPPPPPPFGAPPLMPSGPNGRQQPSPQTVRALNSWKTRILETFQNSQERMRILVDRVGQGRLADTEDPYLKATLYHGRLDARVRYGSELAEDIVSSINRQARLSRESHEDMRELVNDYLVAQHAPERNALHGDGAAGMTNAEARQALARINARADAAAIRSIAGRVRSLHEMSLDALRGAGVISDQLYNRLRSAYQHHVPLNRLVPDQADVAGGIAGRGFDVYSTGIKRAKGSALEVLDVLGNVLSNFEQAMVRSEKNLVDLSSLAFLRGHQVDLAGFMEEQRPPVIGTGPNGQPIYQQTSDPRVLHLFEDGRPLWIRFSDARLAASFKASNSESLPSVLRWVAAITRFYSGLQTRFNPEFALPNKLRDLQETIAYMGAQRQIGARGAMKVIARDPSSAKAVLDYIAGRNTVGSRLYQEMINAGGTTGGMGLSTRESVQLKIDDLDRLAQSSPRRFARRVVEMVDNWNTIFEDSTRLSVYRAARERGLSRDRAAFLAKEASINFNRMGTAGPVVNGLYMFANASIQGSVKMIRSMRNPKVAAAVGVTIAAAVAAVCEWNDDIDPQWRDKVSKWDRLNSLPIVLPNETGEGVRYVSIPVSWGMKPIMVAAAAAYDAAKGIAVDWATALSDITTAMIEAYNPVGGTDLGQALTPTVGDTPLDITRNRSWSGGPIRPDQDRNLPADKQYFMKLKDTKTGRASIKATELLRDYTGIEVSPADLNYAIEQYIGGAGRSVRKTFDTLIGFRTGAPPPADEYPFLSRFYRERSQEEIGRGAGGKSEEITERLRQQSRDRFDQLSHVDDILRSMEGMTQQERRETLQSLRGNRSVFDQVRDGLRMKERGLSWQDKQILRLGIDNGARARFLADELRSLNADGRAARLKELRDKHLVTPEVLQQIRAILAGRQPRLSNPPLNSQSPPVPPPPQRPNAMLPPSNAMSGLSQLPPTERRNAMMP